MRLVDLPGAGNPARRGGPQCRHPRRSEINDVGARDILRRRVAMGANDWRHAALCQTAGLRQAKISPRGRTFLPRVLAAAPGLHPLQRIDTAVSAILRFASLSTIRRIY